MTTNPLEHMLALTYALFETIRKRFNLYKEVRRQKSNASDASSGYVADVECTDTNNKIVLAIEVKDRKLTASHIKEKLNSVQSPTGRL
jgi:hypothetical protein